MSKVIHLSDDAHNKAKAFCKEQGLKMSDWVAALIAREIANGGSEPAPGHSSSASSNGNGNGNGASTGTGNSTGTPAAVLEDNVRALVQKKKVLEHYEDRSPTAEDGLPVYAAPPFWAKANGR